MSTTPEQLKITEASGDEERLAALLAQDPFPAQHGISDSAYESLRRRRDGTDSIMSTIWLSLIALILLLKIYQEFKAGNDFFGVFASLFAFAIFPGIIIYFSLLAMVSFAVHQYRRQFQAWRQYFAYLDAHATWKQEVSALRVAVDTIKRERTYEERRQQKERQVLDEKRAIATTLAKLDTCDKPTMAELRGAFISRQWNSVYYRAYLKTRHWQQMRKMALERAGNRCQICGGTHRLSVHHNTYDRLGCENREDLVVLCQKHHSMAHDKKYGNKGQLW